MDSFSGCGIDALQNAAANVVKVPTHPEFALERENVAEDRCGKVEADGFAGEVLAPARADASVDFLARVVAPGRQFNVLLFPERKTIADTAWQRRQAAGFAVANRVGIKVPIVVRAGKA